MNDRPKPFKAIAAMSRNRVIGHRNRIPWHLPEDFQWFKQTTMGQVLVMGRKTFESIGKALPGRETVVLSRSAQAWPGVRVIRHLEDLDRAHDPRDYFICGGAELYALALAQCSDLYLTVVNRDVEGDAFFPPYEEMFELVEVVRETPEYRILHFRRREPI